MDRPVFLLALAALVTLVGGVPVAGQVPTTMDLGEILDSRPVSALFSIQNPSRLEVARVDLLGGTSALVAEPQALVLDPGETGAVRLIYTPEGKPGDIARQLLIRSSLAQLDNQRVVVTARVETTSPPALSSTSECDECLKFEELFSEERRLADYQELVVLIDFYYDPACSECLYYLEEELPRVAVSTGRLPRVARLDITQTRWKRQLRDRLGRRALQPGDMPVAFVAGEVYQGLEALRLGVRTALGL